MNEFESRSFNPLPLIVLSPYYSEPFHLHRFHSALILQYLNLCTTNVKYHLWKIQGITTSPASLMPTSFRATRASWIVLRLVHHRTRGWQNQYSLYSASSNMQAIYHRAMNSIESNRFLFVGSGDRNPSLSHTDIAQQDERQGSRVPSIIRDFREGRRVGYIFHFVKRSLFVTIQFIVTTTATDISSAQIP